MDYGTAGQMLTNTPPKISRTITQRTSFLCQHEDQASDALQNFCHDHCSSREEAIPWQGAGISDAEDEGCILHHQHSQAHVLEATIYPCKKRRANKKLKQIISAKHNWSSEHKVNDFVTKSGSKAKKFSTLNAFPV